jgi:beta-galactosidase/beta-glucuronidase
MRERFGGFTVAAAVCAGALSVLAEYKPAAAPLMTAWGEKMTPETAWREYPRPQLVRDAWTNLNGLWDYAVTPKNAERPEAWQGQILVPFALESALSGVGRLLEPGELLWYRRTFQAQPHKGQRLLLNFGAVDFRTQVWVNGIEVTDVPHESGNLPFSVDVTKAVKSGDNELVLSVWDPSNEGMQSVGKQQLKPGGCMYTRVSGIWQTAWLESVPETYVSGYKTVTDIDAGTVSVAVQAEGNLMAAQAEVEALRDGKVLAKGEVEAWDRPVTLKLKAPQLWSPATPNLYDLRITLTSASGKDVVKGYFGMRKIEWRADEKGVPRFYVNNQKTFLQGTLDQGWWPDGLLTPPSDEAMAFDISLLKGCGFNMMRKHIKIEPLRYYYLCDKLGIMVWQDMVSGWRDGEDRYALYRRELKGMVDLLQSVPSIVMWVPYNEGWGQPGKAKTNMTQTWVRRYDPTRLVNGPSGWTDHGVGDALDLHRYPGPDMLPVMPDRLSVLGEFGGIGLAIEDHTWAKGRSWGYVSDKTTEESFARYTALLEKLAKLASYGLAASVYTQTSDVEIEINGLVTYDRKHVKYPPAELKKLHQKDF